MADSPPTLPAAVAAAPVHPDRGLPILPLSLAIRILSPRGAGIRDQTFEALIGRMARECYAVSHDDLKVDPDGLTWDHTVGLDLDDEEIAAGYVTLRVTVDPEGPDPDDELAPYHEGPGPVVVYTGPCNDEGEIDDPGTGSTVDPTDPVAVLRYNDRNDGPRKGFVAGVFFLRFGGDWGVSFYVDDPDHGDTEYDDIQDALDAARDAARRDVEPSYGYPWAQSRAYRIPDRYDVSECRAAGFTVAEHTPSGVVYMGVDGGGYDFLSSHWGPLYLARHARSYVDGYPWAVETDHGPILVCPDGHADLGQ